MSVLVLGGTVFFGRDLIAALIARGHRVTTSNRGVHQVDTELPTCVRCLKRCGRRANGSRTAAA
jgi:nucleoside-diphosphate-sugar epimerase